MPNRLLAAALGLAALCTSPAAAADAPAPSQAATAAPADARALVEVIEAAVQAQARFDPAALGALLAEDYVEVSPVGEVDRRDAVLRFYDPANRRPAPQVVVTEPLVRIDGSTAMVIVRLAFSAPAPAAQRPPMLMRATYVLRRVAAGWRIASAQYTPIRASGG